jgi:hypothetical protein
MVKWLRAYQLAAGKTGGIEVWSGRLAEGGEGQGDEDEAREGPGGTMRPAGRPRG